MLTEIKFNKKARRKTLDINVTSCFFVAMQIENVLNKRKNS